MKILLLNQSFYPDIVATGQYLAEVASDLVMRGHEVTVVTGRRAYDDPDKLFSPHETWRGVKIFRVYTTRFGKKAKWRRAMDFLSFVISCSIRLAFLPRHNVVVALTTPPLISFIGACRAKLRREKFCYWVMDLNPDEAIAAGWMRSGSSTAKVLEWMSRFSLRQADRVIALDRFMQDRIIAKGISQEKIIVIPTWSHGSEVQFDTAGRERFRKANNLRDNFAVMYAGNHSPVHSLDTLMQAAEKLAEDPSIMFCFVGGGSEFKRVKLWAEENNRTNVLCLPYQPLNDFDFLSAADAHVVIMGDDFVGLVHPCKIYNILAVDAPIVHIGPVSSHITEILDKLGSNYPSIHVRHGESNDLTDQILALRQKVEGDSRQSTKEVTADFSKRVSLQKVISTIEDLA